MRTIVCLALATVISTSAVARDVAVCGASQGYGFYPKAGLAAADQAAGEWHPDGIKDGRFTLTQIAKEKFDLLVRTRPAGFTL